MAHFDSWIAGFVDGEGCFVINTTKTHLSCRLTVQLRADDRPVLDRICAYMGVGRVNVTHSPSVADRGFPPLARWDVYRKDDCLTLVRFFDTFPLLGKKGRDYEIWRKAVLLHQEVRGGKNNSLALGQIKTLAAELKESRKYAL